MARGDIALWNEEKEKRCKGCVYYTIVEAEPICDYIGQTGTMRPCKPTECKEMGVYEKRRRRKRGETSERP